MLMILFFSADSFDDAQLIANEAIALFCSRGFELVKWSANKESVNVLVGMDSELLAPSIREVDLETNSVVMPSAKTLGCVWVKESAHPVLAKVSDKVYS